MRIFNETQVALAARLESILHEISHPHLDRWGYPFLDRKAVYNARQSVINAIRVLVT